MATTQEPSVTPVGMEPSEALAVHPVLFSFPPTAAFEDEAGSCDPEGVGPIESPPCRRSGCLGSVWPHLLWALLARGFVFQSFSFPACRLAHPLPGSRWKEGRAGL